MKNTANSWLKRLFSIGAPIDMQIEHVLWKERFDSPQVVKNMFDHDCRAQRQLEPYCASRWKLKRLRKLNKWYARRP